MTTFKTLDQVAIDRDVGKALIQVADLALRFSRVERVTYHPDGQRHETDSDHTVVLGLTALPFASRYLPKLDLGLVAQFCFIHDLPEAYAGDTDSFLADDQERIAKAARERKATDLIEMEHGEEWPWISIMLDRYHHQVEPEARFVWAFDKIQPALTHILNGGAYLHRDVGASRHDVARFNARETARIHDRVKDMPPMTELYAIMKALLFEYVYGV